MSNTPMKTVFAAALALTTAAALPVQADNKVAEKALKGAVAGAAIAEVTGGDAAQGAAAGAAVGAVAGAVQKNDIEDKVDNRAHKHNKKKKK